MLEDRSFRKRPDYRNPRRWVTAAGSAGVTVRADAGVSSPVLPALAGELLAAGIVAGLIGAALVVIPVRLAAGRR